MWLSFLKKTSKYKKYITAIDDIPQYMKLANREIQIDMITPQNAETIDGLIRFWNFADDSIALSLSEREPIKIYMNSLGGDLNSAITIMNAIKMSRTPIYTFNIGTVYKESFLIYLAGHKRYAYPNATFMYTDTIFQKPIEEENESTFYNKNSLLLKVQNDIKLFILEKIGITDAQYDKHSKNEWWFVTDDAFKLHICNEILKSHYFYVKKGN